jgi:hypothetical protein
MAGSEHTYVVVDLLEDGAGTLVKLTHSGFANREVSVLVLSGLRLRQTNHVGEPGAWLQHPRLRTESPCMSRRQRQGSVGR